MKRLFRHLLTAAVLCALCVTSATAQTYATTTTLSAALGLNDTTMVVASATGFTVGRYVYIDAEAVEIRSISGTTIGITRGQLGTPQQAHATSKRVITGNDLHFQQSDPYYGQACTGGVGQAAYLPWINVLRGLVWTCVGTSWRSTSTAAITYNSIPTTWP